MSEYSFIVDWLSREPNYELIVPYIKEKISNSELTKSEVDSLRERVTTIRDHGHEVYLECGHVVTALRCFDGSMELPDRVSGGCSNRVR